MEAHSPAQTLGRVKPPPHKGMTIHPPLASLPRLSNGSVRLSSPLGGYSKTHSRAASVSESDQDINGRRELPSKQRANSIATSASASASAQYLVNPDVIRSSLMAAQKSFQSRVQPREWTAESTQGNDGANAQDDGQSAISVAFTEISSQIHRNPANAITEILPDSPVKARVTTLRATLEQLFFRLQNKDELRDDPVFGIDVGADAEMGETNLPLEDFATLAASLLQSNTNNVNNIREGSSLYSYLDQKPSLDKAALQTEAFSAGTYVDDRDAQGGSDELFTHPLISQDHNGEINDFLLGDACKVGQLLSPLPNIEMDKNLVNFADKWGLSEMDIFGLAFDTALDYLSSYNPKGQFTEIIQTLSRVKGYYVSRLTRTPTQLAAYQEAANILDGKLQVTTRDLSAATVENQNLKVKLANMKERYAEATKRIDELVYQNTMQTRDISILSRRLEVSQEQARQLTFTVDVIKSELVDEKNKTRRLAATANRFKSNLERVGDRATLAERKANYAELQILNLEAQKNAMTAEIASLQDQLNTISGTFAKERIALVSENERLTLENNEFQTTLATGGIFFAAGPEDGEANSDVLIRVANKIHKRTDMNSHAKLAATTILRLCADDSRVVCKRLGITNDGLSSLMWLLTASKSSDNVTTFLTHLHGQYSSYFVAKGTAVQTKDSYIMMVREQRKKKALEASAVSLQDLYSARQGEHNGHAPGVEQSDGQMGFPPEYESFSTQIPTPELLIRRSHKVMMNMHKQIKEYRSTYGKLETDSDFAFNELQALFRKYYGNAGFNEAASGLLDASGYDQRCSIPSVTDPMLSGPDVDNSRDHYTQGESSASQVQSSTLGVQDILQHRSPHKAQQSSTMQSKDIARDERLQGNAWRSEHPDKGNCHSKHTGYKNVVSQLDQQNLNTSLESVDFGGNFVSSQIIDDSSDFLLDCNTMATSLQVNVADIPEEVLREVSSKITELAGLVSTPSARIRVTALLQDLLYNKEYNGAILPIFSEYVQKAAADNNALRQELKQKQRAEYEQSSSGTGPESKALDVAADKEMEEGIRELCTAFDRLFEQEGPVANRLAQSDGPCSYSDLGIPINMDLSACTRDTINWALQQAQPHARELHKARRQRRTISRAKKSASQRKKSVRTPGSSPSNTVQNVQHAQLLPQRTPYDDGHLEDLSRDGSSQGQHRLKTSVASEGAVGGKRAPSAGESPRQVYYRDASGEICSMKYSVVSSRGKEVIESDDVSEVHPQHQKQRFASPRIPTAKSCYQQLPVSAQMRLSPASRGGFRQTDRVPRGDLGMNLSSVVLGNNIPTGDLPLDPSNQLSRSRLLSSIQPSVDYQQSLSPSKETSRSRRHQYGLATRDILARVNALQEEEQHFVHNLSTSSQTSSRSSSPVKKYEDKVIVCTTDGTVRVIDKPAELSVREAFMDTEISQKAVVGSATDLYYLAEPESGRITIVSFNPQILPAYFDDLSDRYDVTLDTLRGMQLAEMKSLRAALIPLDAAAGNSTVEDVKPSEIVAVYPACPLPKTIVRAIRVGTKLCAAGVQTSPMVLDAMLTTGDLQVNDAFVVVEKLFHAMFATTTQPGQSEQPDAHIVQSAAHDQDTGEALEGASLQEGNTRDMIMSQFTNIPLFPDSYTAEQIVRLPTAVRNIVGVKDTPEEQGREQNQERAAASKTTPKPSHPLLQMLQTYIPLSQTIHFKGVLGPHGITESEPAAGLTRMPYPHAKVFAKKANDLALSTSTDAREAMRSILRSVANATPVPRVAVIDSHRMDQNAAEQSIQLGSTVAGTVPEASAAALNAAVSERQEAMQLSGPGTEKSAMLQDSRNAMALSAASESFIRNNVSEYKETISDLLTISQQHETLTGQKHKLNLMANKLIANTINARGSKIDGSLMVESLSKEAARDGPLLLRRQQQQQQHPQKLNEHLGSRFLKDGLTLQDRRTDNKILRHDGLTTVQPQLVISGIGGTGALSNAGSTAAHQGGSPPKETMLTYNDYMQALGQQILSPRVVEAGTFAAPHLRVHPRYGHNVLTSQCNPLEPPEGNMLQFTGDAFSAIATRFGCFRYSRCVLPNEVAGYAGNKPVTDEILYPCILSSSTDIFSDFSISTRLGEDRPPVPGQSKITSTSRMRQAYEYMLEHIKHLAPQNMSSDAKLGAGDMMDEGFKLSAKQFTSQKMLVPKLGDTVSYIRRSSLNIKSNEAKPILPPILQLLQELTTQRCELLTVESKVNIDPIHRTYIKVPVSNAYLKSVTWTLKLIKTIYAARLSMDETYLAVKDPIDYMVDAENMIQEAQTAAIGADAEGKQDPDDIVRTAAKDDPEPTRAFSFDIVYGGLSRQEAESLPHFLLYYAKTQYGIKNIVASLIWSLVVSVCYHQYTNNEVYLFARLLFGDLDFDFYLTILSIQSSIGGPKREYIEVSEIPKVVQLILPNWNSKRQYSLCESIYGCKFIKRDKQANLISVAHLAQMLMVAYGGYRRSIFQSITLIWSKLSTDDFLTEGSFRELCETCVPQLSFNSVTEIFYVFSSDHSDIEAGTSTGAGASLVQTQMQGQGPGTVRIVYNLINRKMLFEHFIDFYLSYCLGRYAIITSLTLDEVMRGTEIRRNVQLVSNVYMRLVTLAQNIATRCLEAADEKENEKEQQAGLIKTIRKVFNHLNLVSCDLSAYDYQRAIDNMRQGINLLTDYCMDVKGEAASIVLGGGVAALSALVSRST